MDSNSADKPVIYRRVLVRDLIERLTEMLCDKPHDNSRTRVEYVLKILEKGEGSRKTIILRSPCGIEEIEAHLGVPEIDHNESPSHTYTNARSLNRSEHEERRRIADGHDRGGSR